MRMRPILVLVVLTMMILLKSIAWAEDQKRIIIRDNKGHRIGIIEKGPGKNYIIRDGRGLRKGTRERNYEVK